MVRFLRISLPLAAAVRQHFGRTHWFGGPAAPGGAALAPARLAGLAAEMPALGAEVAAA